MKCSVFYVCFVWASFGLGVMLRFAARRPANQTQTLIHLQRLLLPFSLFHFDPRRGWWFSFCNGMRCDSYVFTLIVFNSWVHYEISKCVAQTAISGINRFILFYIILMLPQVIFSHFMSTGSVSVELIMLLQFCNIIWFFNILVCLIYPFLYFDFRALLPLWKLLMYVVAFLLLDCKLISKLRNLQLNL